MKTQKLKKAGLGTIVKSLRGAVKGAKQGYKTAKTLSKANPQGYSNRVFDNEFAKNVSESVKKSSTVQKKDAVKNIKKGYGDKGQYERLDDMKRSEFYRDRRNAGKTYKPVGKGVTKKQVRNTAIGLGALGAYVGVGSTALSGKPKSKKTTTKKPTAVKKPAPIKKK
jgi:hypothetical protein